MAASNLISPVALPRRALRWLWVNTFAVGLVAAARPALAEERPPEGPDLVQCADQADNDLDGEVDCADEGCAASAACGLCADAQDGIGGLIGVDGVRRGARAELGNDPIILGDLDKSLIDAVILRNLIQIRYCYERTLIERPKLQGTVVVKFVIEKDGSVSSATTASSTLANPSVEECINGRVLRFQFREPKGGGIVIVSYPLLFAPG